MTTFKQLFEKTYNPPIRGRHSKKRRIRRKAAKRYRNTLSGVVEEYIVCGSVVRKISTKGWSDAAIHDFQ